MTEKVHIDFERSGGFAGISIITSIDSEKLPQKEADNLFILLNKAKLSDIQIPGKNNITQPDRFAYKLTIQTNQKKYSFSLDENNIPESLQPLIKYLINKARTGRDNSQIYK